MKQVRTLLLTDQDSYCSSLFVQIFETTGPSDKCVLFRFRYSVPGKCGHLVLCRLKQVQS
jgi:hypothetical protein